MNRQGMRPSLPTFRTPNGLTNAAPGVGAPARSPILTQGAPTVAGPDPFNRPQPAQTPIQGTQGTRTTPAPVKPTLTPAGPVGAAGPVGGASVPTPPIVANQGTKPMSSAPPLPTMRPMMR
jgi:hypothetical protein